MIMIEGFQRTLGKVVTRRESPHVVMGRGHFLLVWGNAFQLWPSHNCLCLCPLSGDQTRGAGGRGGDGQGGRLPATDLVCEIPSWCFQVLERNCNPHQDLSLLGSPELYRPGAYSCGKTRYFSKSSAWGTKVLHRKSSWLCWVLPTGQAQVGSSTRRLFAASGRSLASSLCQSRVQSV